MGGWELWVGEEGGMVPNPKRFLERTGSLPLVRAVWGHPVHVPAVSPGAALIPRGAGAEMRQPHETPLLGPHPVL